MNSDCLKLTTYFGERDRVGRRLLADELLDRYAAHRVQTSVLLRGVEGFGLRHHLHSDRLLSLSEDLPAVAVAVDTRERIEALLADVLAIKRKGLVTLERARLLSGPVEPLELPEELHEATKLTVYVGRGQRAAAANARARRRREPAFVAICRLLHERGIAGATVLLGVDGTSHGERARGRFFGANAQVPMMLIAVGAGARIAAVLPELGELLERPLLTLERVRVCKRDGELLERPHPLPGTDEHGLELWQKLMVYTAQSAQHDGRPLHRALVTELRRSRSAAGATSIRGVWGFHGEHPPHGDRLLQARRHVPVLTTVIDRPARIGEVFEIVDELTRETGLVTSEMVPAAAALEDARGRGGGLRLARHRF